jgi:hypothetical protein
VTRFLGDRFVAAWEKKGTLTVFDRAGSVAKQGGNVIGYVCTSAGEVLHAIPAVPTPRRYLEELEWAESLHDALGRVPREEHSERVARAHRRSQRVGGALRRVHTFFAGRPLPRIRDVEQELFNLLLDEAWSPAAPINRVNGVRPPSVGFR